MDKFNELLQKYAELSVKVGVNLQKDQTLVINSPIECAEFTRLVAKEAYNVGAKDVHVEWNDEELSLMRFMNAPEEVFKEFAKWRADGYEEFAKNGAAFLSISASNPELLKNVNPRRIAESNKAKSIALKKYREYIMNSIVSWSVISIPTKAWSQMVFQNLSEKEAVEKLWETIFKTVRIDMDRPIDAWNEHLSKLQEKVDFLNNKKFKKLHYVSKDTDLTIELPEKHIWAGGGEYNAKQTYFVANMPTEEVFTLPLKTGINGTVKSTKPLNYSGNLIYNFSLTFKDGRIIDFSAEQGYETLKKLIETDEGSHYLGEVALVPQDSPISNSDIIFYNTLFDENASCHLAIGAAYPTCLEEGSKMTVEELQNAGVNDSLTHVDFMVGSSDLDITGTTYFGKTIQIFKNGNWAF
jgi:aminopeptidase